MIVTFALEAAAAAVKADADARDLNQHLSFLKLWHEHGVLVQTPQKSGLMPIIDCMPQRFKTKWQTALRNNRYTDKCGNSFISGAGGIALIDAFKGNVEVIFITEATAILEYDFEEIEPTRKINVSGVHPDKIEVCRFDCANSSESFSNIERLGESMIPEGMQIVELWKARFQRLAELSKHIVIVDRYCCEPGANIEGLKKLLVLIDGSANKAQVSLFTGFGSRRGTLQSPNRSGCDLFERVSEIVAELCRGGIKGCMLHCVGDDSFERYSHGRFLRFDDDEVCEIDVGVAIFSGSHTFRQSNFSMKHNCDDYLKTEKLLRAEADKYSGPIDLLDRHPSN